MDRSAPATAHHASIQAGAGILRKKITLPVKRSDG
jgi:hypothetical protein